MSRIRKAAVAGLFYPENPVELKAMIDDLLAIGTTGKFYGDIFGIVVPHAGYIYSGLTAAYAFNLIKGKQIHTAVIVSPSHREYFPGISIYDGEGYETPFGIVEINKTIADKLTEGTNEIFYGEIGHKNEHAVEVEIPFLQQITGNIKIVPVVMGDQKPAFINLLSRKLADIYDEGVLIVVSSDLSHYHSREEANALDSLVAKHIKDFEYDKLLVDLELNRCEACGGGPIVSMMRAASERKYNKSLLLNRSDSGDVTGDNSEVVGYLSAVIFK
jgi:MEMO1 family protein